jgi:hypothetical protein
MINESKMSSGVTFETKCYEKDWRFLLRKGRLEEMIGNCAYPFADKILSINNVDDYPLVMKEADKLVARGVINRYIIVRDHEEQLLAALQLSKESFKGGYYYSIAEMVSISQCATEYLLHFSGDSLLEKGGKPWIDKAIETMNGEERILAANPCWNFDYPGAAKESFKEDNDWYYSEGGFSDQCYLVKASRFTGTIYTETHPDSARYPEYGGELFEKRIDAYMRNKSLWRITSKHVSYEHENVPSNKFRRFLYVHFNIKTS